MILFFLINEKPTLCKMALLLDLFAKFSKPLIGFLIGGKSKAYKFSHSECNKILDSIRLTLDKGNTPLITISRRTPKNLTIKIKELLKEKEHLLYDGEGPNPYFAILKASDVIVVTPDSANMISEAISVPKPVYFIDMESHSKRFKKFINTLVNSNHIRPFQEELDFFQNKKLDATQEIVDYIHENLFYVYYKDYLYKILLWLKLFTLNYLYLVLVLRDTLLRYMLRELCLIQYYLQGLSLVDK